MEKNEVFEKLIKNHNEMILQSEADVVVDLDEVKEFVTLDCIVLEDGTTVEKYFTETNAEYLKLLKDFKFSHSVEELIEMSEKIDKKEMMEDEGNTSSIKYMADSISYLMSVQHLVRNQKRAILQFAKFGYEIAKALNMSNKRLVDKLSASWICVSDDVPKGEYNTLMFCGGIPEPTRLVWYETTIKQWFNVASGVEFIPRPDWCWLRYAHSDYPHNRF